MFLLLLLACPPDTGDTGSFVDLTVRLDATEARAGVITDPSVLFGGTSGEGRLGDVLLYNDRVRFVVQGMRESGYYAVRGGGLLDADTVHDGPGRDFLDDMMPMFGLARVQAPTSVRVVSTGEQGGDAVVVVEGTGSALALATGALEAPDLIEDVDVDVVTTYTLSPGTHLLHVETELTWHDSDMTLQVGDLLMIGQEQTEAWHAGRGLEDEGPTPAWIGLISTRDDLSLGLFPGGGEGYPESSLADLLSQIGPVLGGVEAAVTVTDGEVLTWTRDVGIGPDLASLTDDWLAGTATTTVAGVVQADGVGVAGVRVNVLDPDGLPCTLALTDETGAFSLQVPDDGTYTAIADGRGPGYHTGLPEGVATYPPFGHPLTQQAALATLDGSGTGAPQAAGYGLSEEVVLSADTVLELTPPAVLSLDAGDDLPCVVRVAFAAGDPVSADARLARARPGGELAWAYPSSCRIDLPVEPGDYEVTVHRGLRWEPWQQTVSVVSGEAYSLSPELTEAWHLDGVFGIDPHSHAAPSGDGEIGMIERLLVHAAHGLDVHVGSDHDNVASYHPLVEALALPMSTVVADEVSPVLRGHFNAYPVELDTGLARNGAPSWWHQIPDSTAQLWAEVRDWAGEDVILQANHPTDGTKGLFSNAGLEVSSGTVTAPDHWADDFQAIEVANGGDITDNVEAWLFLVNAGYRPMPVSVSDSHSYRDGPGENVTWLHTGEELFTEAGLLAAADARATVASRGPMVLVTQDEVWVAGSELIGPQTVDVAVYGSSVVQPDTLTLLQDGEVVLTEAFAPAGSGVLYETTLTLDPERDASFVIEVTGDTAMAPIYPGATPWALTAPVWIDVDGDGWSAPATLTIE